MIDAKALETSQIVSIDATVATLVSVLSLQRLQRQIVSGVADSHMSSVADAIGRRPSDLN